MSAKFRIGDKIRVIQDFECWLDQGSKHDQIFTVVEDNNSGHVFCPVTNTVDLDCVEDWPGDFEIVNTRFSVDLAPEAALNYTTGGLTSDDASVISAHDGSWSIGKFGQVNIGAGLLGSGLDREVVTSLVLNDTKPFEFTTDLTSDGKTYISGLGIGIPPQEVVTLPAQPELGVYRPNLEDRKVGKVRVELVDKGFPNALWEVARLMTKAQEVKGYADHDWKNLPNWQESFPAAASRHRMKHNKGEFFDDEFEDFKILHKVNEAFNVLAELELLIVKRIHE